jgi:hypothetical protein
VGVVLAIDPGRRQGKTIDRLVHEFQGHEIVIATSGEEALAVLDGQVPDLIVFPLFLAPGDEARLQSRLRGLSNQADLQALTAPLHAFFDGESFAMRPAAVPPRWFYWFKPAVGIGYDVGDPRAFAEAVRGSLDRPRPPLYPEPATPKPVSAFAAARVPATPPPPPAAILPPSMSGTEPVVDQLRRASPNEGPSPFESVYGAPGGWTRAPAPPRTPEREAWPPPPATERPAVNSTLFGYSTPPATDEAERAAGIRASLGRATGGALSTARRQASNVAPAAAGLWRLAGSMPRAVWVAAPAVVVLLMLGLTGHVGAVLGAPLRWAGAMKASWFPAQPRTGTAEIQSVPDGAQVWLNGRQIGVTPLRAEFAVGSHEVELRYRGSTRTLTLDVTPGETVVQRIEWVAPKTTAAVTGKLRVETDPAGVSVAIDGKVRGVTPLMADDLAPGRHTVDLTLRGNTVSEVVDIKPLKTTTLQTSVYQGWLALFSPIELRAAVGDRALTLDDQNRALLPAGTHELTLQNRVLGYTDRRTIAIKPGETTAVSVVVPKTILTVTASGPAEVWVDGVRVGDAPVVNLPVDIGTREVVLRSPDRGERRVTVTATVAPVHVAVDFAAPIS